MYRLKQTLYTLREIERQNRFRSTHRKRKLKTEFSFSEKGEI